MADVYQGQSGQWYEFVPGKGWEGIDAKRAEGLQTGAVGSGIASAIGATQEMVYGAGQIANVPGAREKRERATAEAQPFREGSPWAGFAGQAAPYVVPGLAAPKLGVRGAMVMEGGLGATATPDNPFMGAAIGAGGMGALTAAAPLTRRFVGTMNDVVNSSRARASSTVPKSLAREGYQQPFYADKGQAARQIGASIESYAPANLATGAGKRMDTNQTALNRAAGRSILEPFADAGMASREIVERALSKSDFKTDANFFSTVDDIFEDAYGNIGPNLPDVSADFLPGNNALQQVKDANLTSVVKSDKLEKILDRVEALARKGDLAGEQLKKVRSDLSREMFTNFRSPQGDRGLAMSLSESIEIVDRAIEAALGRSGQTEVLDKWRATNKAYRAYKELDKGGAVNIATGDVKPQTLMNNLVRSRGKGDVNSNELFQALEYHLAEGITGIPDSGTATRQFLPQLLTALTAGGVGAMALSD